MLLLVCLHAALKAVIIASSFRGNSVKVIVKELETLYIVLKASVCKLGDIYLIWKS